MHLRMKMYAPCQGRDWALTEVGLERAPDGIVVAATTTPVAFLRNQQLRIANQILSTNHDFDNTDSAFFLTLT